MTSDGGEEEMTKEVEAAAGYWLSQLRSSELEGDQGTKFAANIASALRKKYVGHWHPDQPHRGQAFRSLSIDTAIADPLLEAAAASAGLGEFRRRLPSDMDVIMWVDPGSVTVRYNQTNRTHALYGKSTAPSFVRARDRDRERSGTSYIDRTWSRSSSAASVERQASATPPTPQPSTALTPKTPPPDM